MSMTFTEGKVLMRGRLTTINKALDTFEDLSDVTHAKYSVSHATKRIVLSQLMKNPGDPPSFVSVELGAFVEFDFPELFMPTFNEGCTDSLSKRPFNLEMPLCVFFNFTDKYHWKKQVDAVMRFAYMNPTYETSNYKFVKVSNKHRNNMDLFKAYVIRDLTSNAQASLSHSIDKQRVLAFSEADND